MRPFVCLCALLFACVAEPAQPSAAPPKPTPQTKAKPAAQGRIIQSSDAQVPVARVVKLVNLVDKPHIQVNVIIEDLGGSTDVSPTQRAYFTLYAKGEMFSTDASFDLGPHFGLLSAKRKSGGVYELTFAPDLTTGGRAPVKRVVDARDAIVAMKAVRCDDFDCDASKNFKATIRVTDP